MSQTIRVLAHECRLEATNLNAGKAADPAAIAHMLTQCATTLEEIDALALPLQQIQDHALRLYRRSAPDHEITPDFLLSLSQEMAALMIDLCAYLAKENKAHA